MSTDVRLRGGFGSKLFVVGSKLGEKGIKQALSAWLVFSQP
jgi:hypothetical protein